MILTIILVHAEGTNSEAIILRELISRIVQFLLDHTWVASLKCSSSPQQSVIHCHVQVLSLDHASALHVSFVLGSCISPSCEFFIFSCHLSVININQLKKCYRRWAGKTSYVHLAPEHEYRYKHLMKAYKNQFKTCSMALNTFKGFCWLSCGPETCMKLIIIQIFFFFIVNSCSGAKCTLWGFSCPATLCWRLIFVWNYNMMDWCGMAHEVMNLCHIICSGFFAFMINEESTYRETLSYEQLSDVVCILLVKKIPPLHKPYLTLL